MGIYPFYEISKLSIIIIVGNYQVITSRDFIILNRTK